MKAQAVDEKIARVFLHWVETMKKPRARLDEKREKKIGAAIRMGYAVDDLCVAIDGCKASRWHMGENDRRRQYINIELIFRDADHIDDFMDRAPKKQVPRLPERVKTEPTFDPAIRDAGRKAMREIAGVRRK